MTHKLFFELCIQALHRTPTTIQLEELPKEYWDKAIEVMKECLELGVTDALRMSASFSEELNNNISAKLPLLAFKN